MAEVPIYAIYLRLIYSHKVESFNDLQLHRPKTGEVLSLS